MELNCPIPDTRFERIVLAHGGGGKISNQLVNNLLLTELGNVYLNQLHDGASLPGINHIAFSTDSFVVQPIFFPGGDIGELAVCGTVNDLVCCGAIPKYLSLSFILEEGFEMESLKKIIRSIRETAKRAGVMIVTGDTKVVEKGKGDQIFINTAGIGDILPGLEIHPHNIQPGDKIIINGSIAEHGMAILSSREGLQFETTIQSDTAPLNHLLNTLYRENITIHMMRDPTRGGLASALNEICMASQMGITLFEKEIPVLDEVRGACEIIGFDPLYVANEGKILFFIPKKDAIRALQILKSLPHAENSCIIGEVTTEQALVKMNTVIGSDRIIDMISGEQLPRIC
jgi:hydrogenase expression/formation protein HypE